MLYLAGLLELPRIPNSSQVHRLPPFPRKSSRRSMDQALSPLPFPPGSAEGKTGLVCDNLLTIGPGPFQKGITMQVLDSRPGQAFITWTAQYAFPAVGEAHWTQTREAFSSPRKLIWACFLYHDAVYRKFHLLGASCCFPGRSR